MSFKDIKGQDIPISFLKRAITKNTIAHAYLFAGMDGVGKSFVAHTFAKALNCEKDDSEACDVCTSCRKIENRNHPDLFWVAPKGNGGVIKIDTIRALEERISLKPYEAKWKVYIIEDAHLMTEEAENCLLKTLEEPPPYSLIILTTSNISGLFQTIVSRCQVVKFSPLAPEIIEWILIKKFGFLKENARFISHLSGGGVNKKAILEGEDYIIWKNKIIDEFMKGSFFEEDSLMFSSFKENSQRTLLILINWYRDILVYPECRNISRISSGSRPECSYSRSDTSGSRSNTSKNRYIRERDSKEENFIRDKNGIDETSVINIDRLKDLDYFANNFSYEDINRRLDTLMDAYLAVGQNVNPKLVIGALV